MFAKERQAIIYKMIRDNDTVSTSNLVKTFAVSTETIRRDLLEMENSNLLKRVHGGAIKIGDMRPFVELEQRHRSNEAEKSALAKLALLTVREGDIIALDSGSTAIFFAEALKESLIHLTVITHSLDVFDILQNNKNLETILCGGNYMRNENAFHGMLTLQMLDQLRVDKSFICPSAVSVEFGICDYTPELCMIQKKMMEISDKIYILADSSKFEKRALIKLSDTNPGYTYITDYRLKDEIRNLYSENGINILTGKQ